MKGLQRRDNTTRIRRLLPALAERRRNIQHGELRHLALRLGRCIRQSARDQAHCSSHKQLVRSIFTNILTSLASLLIEKLSRSDYGGMDVYTKQILGSSNDHDAFYTNDNIKVSIRFLFHVV